MARCYLRMAYSCDDERPMRASQLAAFIQQRIHHVCQRQRPTPLPSPTAKSRHQPTVLVDTTLTQLTRNVAAELPRTLVSRV